MYHGERARRIDGTRISYPWRRLHDRRPVDRVNAKVMKDPRLATSMDAKKLPFDPKRMAYAGFQVLVDE